MLWFAGAIGVLLIAAAALWFTVWAERALALESLHENSIAPDAN